MFSSLPERPSLEWLRKTAKQVLNRLREQHRDARLADAQLSLAREYGFSSWRHLVQHIEQLNSNVAQRLPPSVDEELTKTFLQYVGRGQIEDVRRLLRVSPTLVNAVGPHPFWGGRPQSLHVAI